MAVVVFWWTLGLLLTLATQAQPPAQRFKSSVDVVQVDVSAIDASGRPIRDLTAADFAVRVDGRVRPIVSAQFVAVPSSAEAPPPAAPPHYSSNAGSAGGRLIVIVVDRSSIATGRGKAAIEAASRFVTGLNHADRVALASIPSGPQVGFTADHALVQRLLQQIDGTAIPSFGTRNIGVADALAFERRDEAGMQNALERECGTVTDSGRGGGGSDVLVCRNEVRAEAGLVAADARERARQSIRGLQALIESLAPSQTPKMLVYISEGLIVERESAQLSWLEAVAAAAHVTVYPLHLESSLFDASQRRPQSRATANRTLQEHGLSMMAQATRGDVFRVISNSDFAFERLSNELSGYYLLGFEPEPTDRNGRPHTISVIVGRKGVTVRSRRQFTIGAEPLRTAQTEVVAALRDPLPAAEIPIKVTTYSLRDPHHDKLRVLIAAEIDRSINPGGQISVGYVVVDFDGKLMASQFEAVLPPATGQNARVGRYFSPVRLDPGKYSLKFVAVDDGRRRGSVERVVSAGLMEAESIHATDLLLADGAAGAGELPLSPAVSGDIAGKTLHAYMELFADSLAPLQQAQVTFEIGRTETSPVLQRAAVTLRTPEDNSRCRIAGGTVDIGALPPGDYVARAAIAIGPRTVGRVVRPFRITR